MKKGWCGGCSFRFRWYSDLGFPGNRGIKPSGGKLKSEDHALKGMAIELKGMAIGLKGMQLTWGHDHEPDDMAMKPTF